MIRSHVWARALLVSAAIAALGASTGCSTPLIGGECAEGYEMIDDLCLPLCPEGYTRIFHVCRLDEGQRMIMGLSFASARARDPAASLLGNAVYLPLHDPVRILDYREHTVWNSSEVTNTVDVIAGEGVRRSRTVTTHVAEDADAVLEHLDAEEVDVLLVHDQRAAPPGVLGEMGAAWASAIDAFVGERGIVIVLATAEGTDEMGAFLDRSGLLPGAEVTPVLSGPLRVADAGDLLSVGVPTGVPITPPCASFGPDVDLSPTLSRVLVTLAGAPVVLRRGESPVSAPP